MCVLHTISQSLPIIQLLSWEFLQRSSMYEQKSIVIADSIKTASKACPLYNVHSQEDTIHVHSQITDTMIIIFAGSCKKAHQRFISTLVQSNRSSLSLLVSAVVSGGVEVWIKGRDGCLVGPSSNRVVD